MGSESLNIYLSAPTKAERIRLLESTDSADTWIPLDLSEDLLCIDLDPREHMGIIARTDPSAALAYEDFITRGVTTWDQNLASAALRHWAQRSPHLLWHRTLPMSRDTQLAQRVLYTLLDLSWTGAGDQHILPILEINGLEGMSHAFLALLLQRSLQWNVYAPRLSELAAHATIEPSFMLQGDRLVANALAYLLRFAPERLPKTSTLGLVGIWPEILRSMQSPPAPGFDIFIREAPASCSIDSWLSVWPQLWHRHSLSASAIRAALQRLPLPHLLQHPEASWELFAGIPSSTLAEACLGLESPDLLCQTLQICQALLAPSDQQRILPLIQQQLQRGRLSPSTMAALPWPFRLALAGLHPPAELTSDEISAIQTEQKSLQLDGLALSVQLSARPPLLPSAAARRNFFDRAYRERVTPTLPSAAPKLWALLAEAWLAPQEAQLEALSQAARQENSLFKIAYINTLGRFRGHDKAALKLLDFIRTQDDDMLRAVIRALVGIGTNRAKQELVSFITRPNATASLRLEIAQYLRDIDLSELQNELRSALQDLSPAPGRSEASTQELRDLLQDMLKVGPSAVQPTITLLQAHPPPHDTAELDGLLTAKIPTYSQLSSEVKRALRTAQFFHLNVTSARGLNTIDLSPVIDMQYKALELFFRESFEEASNQIIRNGMMQRKLDYIGYARPVPQAMDEFEKYIERLPIISTIPFFSSFKLRKMLRALCQYRPGKRFTLDGLKAFALFFICFSRKSCRYELHNLFPIPTFDDAALFEFCKSLHIFQDFRNRAAHEGFHPDAANDIDSTWVDSAAIFQSAFQVRDALHQLYQATSARDLQHSAVIVERKVS